LCGVVLQNQLGPIIDLGIFPSFVPASRNAQILGLASICWAIWKLRNRACFDKKFINSPLDLICYSIVFMKYWAGLNSSADQEVIRMGADNLIATATGVRPPRRGCKGILPFNLFLVSDDT
jgi:hypothetical protein